MPSEGAGRIAVLQGTLDLIVLRTLEALDHSTPTPSPPVNQGTLYPALVRLEQQDRIKGAWGKTGSNREAKFYAITKAGQNALGKETQRWRRLAGLVEKLLTEES